MEKQFYPSRQSEPLHGPISQPRGVKGFLIMSNNSLQLVQTWFAYHTIDCKTDLIHKTTINQIAKSVTFYDDAIELGIITDESGVFTLNNRGDVSLDPSKKFSIPNTFIRYVNKRDEYMCVYCGMESTPERESYKKKILSIDHIKPRCKMPRQAVEDLATACIFCNMEKSKRTPEQFGLLPSFLNKNYIYKDQMILRSDYGI